MSDILTVDELLNALDAYCPHHESIEEYSASCAIRQRIMGHDGVLRSALVACERERAKIEREWEVLATKDLDCEFDRMKRSEAESNLALARAEAERLRGALRVAVAAIENWEDADFNSGGGETHALHVGREGLSAARNAGRAALSPSSPAAPSSAAPPLPSVADVAGIAPDAMSSHEAEYRRGYERAVEDAVKALHEKWGSSWHPEHSRADAAHAVRIVRSLLPAPREVTEAEPYAALRACVESMEAWGAEEDGIPEKLGKVRPHAAWEKARAVLAAQGEGRGK